MANLPVRREEVPTRVAAIRRLIQKGWTEKDIVDKLAGDDARKAKSVRTQLRNLIYNDAEVQNFQGQVAKGSLFLNMPEMTDALVRRASKGNIPAIKLAMEASGFYRPGVDHKHSGRIEIELKGVPRAPIVTDEDSAPIPDATVVEE